MNDHQLHATELRRLEETRERWVAAFNAADIEGLAAILAADLVELPDGAAPVRGREAAAARYAAVHDKYAAAGVTGRLGLRSERTWIDGDLAVDVGELSVVMTPTGEGEARLRSRRYIDVWRRQPDGSWQLAFDMENGGPAGSSEA